MENNKKHECKKCRQNLRVHEVEIFNNWFEVGAYCDNEKCERYLILVI